MAIENVGVHTALAMREEIEGGEQVVLLRVDVSGYCGRLADWCLY
jgi:hypothetical protein